MIESHATKRMSVHFRWKEDIGHSGLFEAIAEALQKGNVLKEAGIITIEADSPDLSMSSLIVVTKEDKEEDAIKNGHEVGFDGCPACTVGGGKKCQQCDYDCCSDCTFDSENIFGATSEGNNIITVKYWNEICNCEGHNCLIEEENKQAKPQI